MRCLREVRLVRTLVTDRVLLGYVAMTDRGKISTHTGYRPCVLLGYDAMSKRGKISTHTGYRPCVIGVRCYV